jgi:fumarate reductase subunit D
MNMQKNIQKILSLILFFSPTFVLAQGFSLFGFASMLLSFVNDVVVFLLFAFAVIFFIFNVVMYIYHGDDEGKRKESRDYIIYGIIVLTVMFSIYGVIQLVAITFGISNIGIPQFGK